MKLYCEHKNLISELYQLKRKLWYSKEDFDSWSFSIMAELYGIMELQKNKAFNQKRKNEYQINNKGAS